MSSPKCEFIHTFSASLKTESPESKFGFLKECLLHFPFPSQDNGVFRDFSQIYSATPVQIGMPKDLQLIKVTRQRGTQCKAVLIFLPLQLNLAELKTIIRNTATFTIFTWKESDLQPPFKELLNSGLSLEKSKTFYAPFCEILGHDCAIDSGQGSYELETKGVTVWYFDTYFEGASHFEFCNDNIRNIKDLGECNYQHMIHYILSAKLNMTFLHVRVKNGKPETENFPSHAPINLEVYREYANPDLAQKFQPGDALILNDIWNSQLMYCTIDRIFEKPTWTYFTRPMDLTTWICVTLTALAFSVIYRNIRIGLNIGLILISQPPQRTLRRNRLFIFPFTSILFLIISQYYQSILTTDITSPPKAKITANYKELFSEHKYVFSTVEYGAEHFIREFSKTALRLYGVQLSVDNFKATQYYVPTFQYLADCECIENFVEPTALKRTGRKLGLRNKNFSCYAMDGKPMEEFPDTLTIRAGINSILGENVYGNILHMGAGGIIQFWYQVLILSRPAYERRKNDSQDGKKNNGNGSNDSERSLPLDSSIQLIFILHLLVLLGSILILVVEVFWKNAEYVSDRRSKSKATTVIIHPRN